MTTVPVTTAGPVVDYRDYFFEISDRDMIAFFEWPDVGNMPEKDHGVPVKGPFAFDHISFGDDDDLWKDKTLHCRDRQRNEED